MCALYPHLLVIKEGPSAGKIYPLEGVDILIGREASSTIQIDSPGVSRKHARLTYQNNQYLLQDLDSSNGTFLNGEQIVKTWPLNNGDIISIGRMIKLVYQVELPPVSVTMIEGELPLAGETVIDEAPQQPIIPTHPPPASLVINSPPQELQKTMIAPGEFVTQRVTLPQFIVVIAGQDPKTYSLSKTRVTIGRAEDNDIVIDSRIVSRHHAYLDRLQNDYFLTVIPEAGNPVLFEGRPLSSSHKLQHGDILWIGILDPGMMVTMTYIEQSQPDYEASCTSVNY